MPFQSLQCRLVIVAGNCKFYFHLKKVGLKAYFLLLGMNCLQDYISVRDLNATGSKIGLVAQAFAAF